MADEDPDPQPRPAQAASPPGKAELLRAAGFTVVDGGLDDARARVESSTATVTAESRVESRERLREIMGWS